MYVAPRPRLETDPLFAIRLGAAATLAFVVQILIGSAMPMIGPSLTVGLMAGMRDAMDPSRAFGGPLGMAGGALVFGWLFDQLGAMPLVLLAVTWGLTVLGFYLILSVGNGAGMLIVVLTLMMGCMRMYNATALGYMQSGFISAALHSLWIIPLAYLVFPAKGKEPMEEIYYPAKEGHHGIRAAIRGTVITLVCLSLFLIFGGQNIMVGVAACFVLCFSAQSDLENEAKERSLAVIYGSLWSVVTLVVAQISGHLALLLLMLMLAGTWFGHKMMFGRHAPMVYQFGMSVFVSLTISILSPSAPIETIVVRIASVMGGALVAAFLTKVLENIILGERIHDRLPPELMTRTSSKR